ncbi:MAG: TlpA family protein disulfide reductase [Chloroflexota bacterium]|nr:MAG: TlpA family protein disulfide reductase [Chloroflexota bacterium]
MPCWLGSCRSTSDARVTSSPTPRPVPPPPGPAPAPRRRRGVGPFSLRQVAGALGVVVVAAVVLTIATAPLGSTAPGLPNPAASAYLLGSPIPGLRVGDLAPELAGTSSDGSTFVLADLDGNPIRLADLRGRAVWINFWASWCPPCQAETPILREIDEGYRDRGLSLVAVQVQQTVDDGLAYADRYGLEYAIGADVSAAVFRTYRVFALPTQFFIDPDGVIRAVVNGPLDLAGASALVESILPGEVSPGPSASDLVAPSPTP